ncbi:Crp/Fnr family transcriptional regulator [Geminicoccus flavidas]|uniref:Crp/Fnr family transcriptional regulator n=1 Tax=Geminicoccus flavidas TaxID=2506407 RepID=UPI0021023FF8|nr:cyclic nucleotide-binding domain-containing protein [Geminicoccus flavidas]
MADEGALPVTVAQLAQARLFQNLPPAALESLGSHCTCLDHGPGEAIVGPSDDTPPCVFLILKGQVEILQDDGPAGLVRVGQTSQGGLVGEFTAIDGVRGGCTVRAVSVTRCISIPRSVFRNLIEQHPIVALRLLHDMVSVIRRLNNRVASLQGAHAEFERIRRDLFRYMV